MDPAEYARLVEPDVVATLDALTTDEVRSLRARAQAVEDEVSYVRRIAQVRLDLVRQEIDRRRDGGAPSSLADVVAALPDTLSDKVLAAPSGRAPRQPIVAPDDATDELDEMCAADQLAALGELDDTELVAVHDRLWAYEGTLSERRRRLFDVIDAAAEELTRRYRAGDASVDSILG